MTVFAEIEDLVAKGEPVAVLTIVDKEGSAPREIGARMAVSPDEAVGTIGGGTVESLAVESAREILTGEAEPGTRTYDLRPEGNTGMVCGGSMDVFIDLVRGQRRLFIAGGGHIGEALAEMAQVMEYEVVVIDDREEFTDLSRFPDGVEVINGDYYDDLIKQPITRESAVVVATRSNAYDRNAVQAALDGGAGYTGLVASETKTEHVLDGLREKGYGEAELAGIRAPVGLDLGGSSPEALALAILSEVQADFYNASATREDAFSLDDLAVVRGGGDLGTGVAYRLHQAGYPVVITDVERPTAVRRAVAFAEAAYEDEVEIEGTVGRLVENADDAVRGLRDDEVAVLQDPDAEIATELDAAILIDAIMAKGKFDTGTRRDDADIVIGLGPGFEADGDVDAVVETDRGHELGRVYYEGTATEYNGEPGERRGFTHERVLRSPTAGTWETEVAIGDIVEAGDTIGFVGDDPVETEIDGIVRGLVHEDVSVEKGAKMGDVDPRGQDVDPGKISDKALDLGGGVLEAVLRLS
ncbi:selenium-dependent molybdenum cofactor biosynthesis protein YqeB [Halodesulfurarchaeum sp.]|uniref:selenium-dependent molybdenum cofactor biosynthesis protein YqeB n=1 Tax=Halodesulfurarchaeum sp. TaxID=1980530 RepID=UPI002FC3B77B